MIAIQTILTTMETSARKEMLKFVLSFPDIEAITRSARSSYENHFHEKSEIYEELTLINNVGSVYSSFFKERNVITTFLHRENEFHFVGPLWEVEGLEFNGSSLLLDVPIDCSNCRDTFDAVNKFIIAYNTQE